jgi:serine/threonine protein kinase
LTPGTRIGVYELTGHIGSGGMAEVYRARDTTLGREVAIKVLPEAPSRDPARLARFERELEVSALGGPPRPLASSLHGGDVSHDGVTSRRFRCSTARRTW